MKVREEENLLQERFLKIHSNGYDHLPEGCAEIKISSSLSYLFKEPEERMQIRIADQLPPGSLLRLIPPIYHK